jgi:uncharacterized protein
VEAPVFKIGVLQIELYMSQSGSLKQKRFILQGLKDRLRKKFNISVIEAGYQDKWQRSLIAAACISTDEKIITGTFNKILDLLDAGRGGYEILRDYREII